MQRRLFWYTGDGEKFCQPCGGDAKPPVEGCKEITTAEYMAMTEELAGDFEREGLELAV